VELSGFNCPYHLIAQHQVGTLLSGMITPCSRSILCLAGQVKAFYFLIHPAIAWIWPRWFTDRSQPYPGAGDISMAERGQTTPLRG